MGKLPVEIDYSLAMTSGIGAVGGVSDEQLNAEGPSFERGLRRIQEDAAEGRIGFWNLPTDRTLVDAVNRYAEGVDPAIRDVLVLGIGGSSLGTRALYDALAGPLGLDRDRPAGSRRLHLPDNSDPWLLANLLATLEPKSTLAVVISKSGGTVETAAQLLVVRKWLSEALGADTAKKHLVVITDPDRGPLRDMTQAESLTSFKVPTNVGGRFSVLSAVGMLPARLAGIDVSGVFEGAAAMVEPCQRPSLWDNPAAILAAVHVLHHRLFGRDIHVIMPYADALRAFASWYVQLWAESLGKQRDQLGRIVETGPTPIASVGATDQHAQVQLFMEGPRNKFITFVHVKEAREDLQIPTTGGDFAYLGGRSLKELLDAEQLATAVALARDGRPSATLSIERLDAQSLGALFFLYEAATAFAGELYYINAFDQPGVEAGKRLASGLLGRKGYEEAGDEVRRYQSQLPDRYRIG